MLLNCRCNYFTVIICLTQQTILEKCSPTQLIEERCLWVRQKCMTNISKELRNTTGFNQII
jgi:hypothetical protein